jgi:uncharacterized RDD family membrane protein YckC
MAQETIQLNRPLFEEPKGGLLGKGNQTSATPRRVPVFAGFWIRFLALSFDVLLLVVLHNFLAAAGMRETFYALGPWCALVGFAAFLLLFVYVPAEILPGQTLGKKMLRLRVVTEDSGHPSKVAFLKRFTVVFGVFLAQWLIFAMGLISDAPVQSPLIPGFLMAAVVGLYVAQISLFFMNPFKQGLHDMWAGTYVVRTDNPDSDPASAVEAAGDVAKFRSQRARKMALIMLPALTLVLGGQLIFQRDTERDQWRRELVQRLREIAGPDVGFDAVAIPPLQPEFWVLQVQIPHVLPVSWDQVRDSSEYREMFERLLSTVEAEYDPARFGDTALAKLPFAGSLGAVVQQYTLVPSLLFTQPLAADRRAEVWNRQYRRVPTENGLLGGTPLIPFSASPETTATPASP